MYIIQPFSRCNEMTNRKWQSMQLKWVAKKQKQQPATILHHWWQTFICIYVYCVCVCVPFPNTGQDLYDFITFINFAFEIYRHSKEFVRVLRIAFDLGAGTNGSCVQADRGPTTTKKTPKIRLDLYYSKYNEGGISHRIEIPYHRIEQTTATQEHSKFVRLLVSNYVFRWGHGKSSLVDHQHYSCFW